jgi:hypothetical protein
VPLSIPSALMSSSTSGQCTPVTISDDLVVRPLGWGGGRQPPGPGEWDADDPAVRQVRRDHLVRDLDSLDPGIAPNRSANSTPPRRALDALEYTTESR